jgi:alginate O-acetyltransferase complex protein AlgJ
VYFRGDSHANSLGAYFVYQHAIRSLQSLLNGRLQPPIPLTAMTPLLTAHDGDLKTKLSATEEKQLMDHWPDLQFSGAFEYYVRYVLPAQSQLARPGASTKVLDSMQFGRPIHITQVDDPSLPRAVIFYDSTADAIIELLAEHFNRAVFVWHKGEVIAPIVESEQPDVVLQFMAERFVFSYGTWMVPFTNGPQIMQPATQYQAN